MGILYDIYTRKYNVEKLNPKKKKQEVPVVKPVLSKKVTIKK